MEKLSRKRAIELHREMWRDLARTGGDKHSHPLNLKYSPADNCFLCEYKVQDEKRDCCLLRWKSGRCVDPPLAEYKRWRRADSLEERKKWAAIIAELPEVPAKKGRKK